MSYLDTGADHSNNLVTARWNRNTGIFTGGSIDAAGGNYAEAVRPTSTYINQGNLTFLPKGIFNGAHEFKAGYRLQFLETHTDVPNHPAGNYQLTYDVVTGVAPQCRPGSAPTAARQKSSSSTRRSRRRTTRTPVPGYVNDKWNVGPPGDTEPRRALRLRPRVPARADQDTGQFGVAGTFPAFEGNTFKNFAPRAGVALSLTEDNKTVIKAHLRSVYNRRGSHRADPYNLNAISRDYRWHDLNQQRRLRSGRGGPRLNEQTSSAPPAAANNIFNPDLERTQLARGHAPSSTAK